VDKWIGHAGCDRLNSVIYVMRTHQGRRLCFGSAGHDDLMSYILAAGKSRSKQLRELVHNRHSIRHSCEACARAGGGK
jgi:hypothetical protein